MIISIDAGKAFDKNPTSIHDKIPEETRNIRFISFFFLMLLGF
jgi:hypothetical protein